MCCAALRCVREGEVRHFVGCQIGCWVLRRDSGGCPASSGGRACLSVQPWRSPSGQPERVRVRVISILRDITTIPSTSSAASSATSLCTDCVLLSLFLCIASVDAVAFADWATTKSLHRLSSPRTSSHERQAAHLVFQPHHG